MSFIYLTLILFSIKIGQNCNPIMIIPSPRYVTSDTNIVHGLGMELLKQPPLVGQERVHLSRG